MRGVGKLYEDGTYIIQSEDGKSNLSIDNLNGGLDTFLMSSVYKEDGKQIDDATLNSMIKTVKFDGNMIVDKLDIAVGVYHQKIKNLDLTGVTLSDKVIESPLLALNSTSLERLTLDPKLSLSKTKNASRGIIDGAPNLKLTNEQVSQLLKDTSFESASNIFNNVGVERLDLSSFDNSKLKESNHLFVNLLGLKEVVFGDKFDFNKYERTNSNKSFFDTNLSTVERVTFEGNKENNSKFIKDWLLDVKKHNVANAEALYHDGKYVGTVDEIINSDKATYEDGIYTLGVNKPNKPEDKTDTEIIEPEVEYVADNTRNFGTPNERVEGEKGTKTTVTTYEWDEASKSYKEKQLEPVIKKPTKTIIKVGTKSKVEEKEIPFEVEYKEDKTISSIDLDTMWKLRVEGKKGKLITTTTYTLNTQTGEVTENTTTSTEKPVNEFRVIGIKPEVTTEIIPITTKYEEDKTKEARTTEVVNPGKEGKIVTTTNFRVEYSGDNNEFYSTIAEEPVVDKTEMVQKVVKVGTKPKVVTEELQPKVVYQKDDTKEKGLENETIPGKKGSKVTTTTYTLNKETGEVTENVGTPVITNPTNTIIKVPAKDKVVYQKDGNDIVKVTTTYTVDEKTGNITEESTTELFKKDGLKPKVTTEVIPVTTKEEKDDSKVVGTTEIINPGKEGKIVTTTPYILNEKDGTVKEGTPTVEKTEMIQKVVKVGTHPASEVPNEAPSYELPEFNGGVNPNEAPSVDVPEFNGGVNPNEAPSVDVPEFNGGVNPSEAPVHDKPEFNGDLTKEEDKSKDTKNKKSLPNTGMASGSIMTLLGGLSFAGGLGLSRKKKED